LARVLVFLVVVAMGIAGALFLISQRSAITRTGYRVAQSELDRRRLVEQNRHLEARVARLKTPASLVKRIQTLQLDLVPPEEALMVPAAATAGRPR